MYKEGTVMEGLAVWRVQTWSHVYYVCPIIKLKSFNHLPHASAAKYPVLYINIY